MRASNGFGMEETVMSETQTTQNQTTATRKGSSNGEGGSGVQQGRNVTQQESRGRTNRAVTRRSSQGLAATAQSPFAMMRQLSREMDRLMDSFFERGFGSLLSESSSPDEEWEPRALWTPQIDVQQRNDAVVVRADLPGVRKEDVQVEVESDALIISGQRREEREAGGDDQGYRMVERSYGSFYRSVPLPQGANPDDIEATMRDGVLTVTLPVPEAARPRKITIQS
jgi:HSP20 family protein